jgi:glycerate kinase
VVKIQISIVGTLSNREEVNEVENIAKVFVIEQRVMDLAEDFQTPKNITKTQALSPKKHVIKNLLQKSQNQILSVRGLT